MKPEKRECQLVKLVNDDDVICLIGEQEATEEKLFVRYPLLLVAECDEETMDITFNFIPWIPFDIDDKEDIGINQQNIFTVVSVPNPLKKIYFNNLETFMNKKIGDTKTPKVTHRFICEHTWK